MSKYILGQYNFSLMTIVFFFDISYITITLSVVFTIDELKFTESLKFLYKISYLHFVPNFFKLLRQEMMLAFFHSANG